MLLFLFFSRSTADSFCVLWTEHFPEAPCQATAGKWINKEVMCNNDNEI